MNNSFEHIETNIQGAIAFIQLNRPEVLNALNRKMVLEIVTAMENFDRDDQVRVIVLSGKGRAFAAGADIDEMANESSIGLELLNQFSDWDRIALIKKPIIGAIHGFAFGGGFELALSCDLLFTAEQTEFAFPEVNIGVMPGAGGTQRLTKLIGKTKAMEWLFTGDRMTAEQALQLGIVNRVIAKELLLEETIKFAERISKQPPLSIRYIKESVLKAIDYPLQEGMFFERKNFSMLFASNDQKEGMRAFIEKRKPKFKGN